MAQAAPTTAMALASPAPSFDVTKVRDNEGGVNATAATREHEKLNGALLTPPNSNSPDLSSHDNNISSGMQSPPPIDIEQEMDLQEPGNHQTGSDNEHANLPPEPTGTPLSKYALSGLDASATITPAMLARDHLPRIMLGAGPRPIRYVIGELTHSVPGFSRIPAPKARRLVVAALESRHGGGVDGNVTFSKTGWGRWDAHVKGSGPSSKDSGVGSFHEGHGSPPRSDRSSYGYAMSNGDSGVHLMARRRPHGYRSRDHHSGSYGSWKTTSSHLREEDEFQIEDVMMDVPENEADKMSLDGSLNEEDDESSSMNDDTDTEDDWAAAGPAALRKASLPTPGAPRLDYNALAIPGRYGAQRSGSRRPSQLHSASLPRRPGMMRRASLDPSNATPEEKAAVAALLSLGSM